MNHDVDDLRAFISIVYPYDKFINLGLSSGSEETVGFVCDRDAEGIAQQLILSAEILKKKTSFARSIIAGQSRDGRSCKRVPDTKY